MEFKHFSHNHNLVFHQLPQGREIRCSGCETPGSGPVYACWQCSFFLHEQCFRATRSLKHFSHPLHPLTLVPYPTHPSNSFYCDLCKLIGNGLSYCCAECEFDLHIHCAMANNRPPIDSLPHYSQAPYSNPNYPVPGGNPGFDSNQSYQAPGGNPGFDPNPNYPTPGPGFDPHYMPPPPPSYPIQNSPSPNFPAQNATAPSFTPPPVAPMNNQPAPVAPPPAYPSPPPPAYPQSTSNVNNNQQSSSTANQPTENNPIPVFPPATPTVNIPLAGNNNNQPKVNEIKHFSHPHALKKSEFTKQNGLKCSGCGFIIDGSGYICVDPQCDFVLDTTCFESPAEVKHKSHLDHPLKLLVKPSYPGGSFTCNACLKDGTGFVYNCSVCSYDLHVDCVAWPETVKREDHKHPLTLFYASPAPPPKTEDGEGQHQHQPEVTTVCDVCQNQVHEMAWTYYCHECDFVTHLECIINQVSKNEKSEEEMIAEAALKLKVLQILLSGRTDILL